MAFSPISRSAWVLLFLLLLLLSFSRRQASCWENGAEDTRTDIQSIREAVTARLAEMDATQGASSLHDKWVEFVRAVASEIVSSPDPTHMRRAYHVVWPMEACTRDGTCEEHLASLKANDRWETRYGRLVPDFLPSDYFLPECRCAEDMPEASSDSIQKTWLLMFVEQVLGVDISEMRAIVEIGGGNGQMRSIARRAGFDSDKPYVTFDDPIICLYQKLLLSVAGEKTHDNLKSWLQAGARGWVCISTVEEMNIVARAIGTTIGTEQPGVLMWATWSMSEMPMELRQQLLPVLSFCTHYFLTYQLRFEDLENWTFFSLAANSFMAHVEGHFSRLEPYSNTIFWGQGRLPLGLHRKYGNRWLAGATHLNYEIPSLSWKFKTGTTSRWCGGAACVDDSDDHLQEIQSQCEEP